MLFIEKLLKELKQENRTIYIQTHNFPDPDAVATAFGLQNLLKAYQISSRIIYDGNWLRGSLQQMLDDFKIEMTRLSDISLSSNDRLIIVDGCPVNNNVTETEASIIAVIDHHPFPQDFKADHYIYDIRPELGSCATLISSYFRDCGINPDTCTASALLVGLQRDTDRMTRKVGKYDMEAYSFLFSLANTGKVSTILRNNIQLSDLDAFLKTIQDLKINNDRAYCYLPNGCSPELLAILGDFILSIREIKTVLMLAFNGDVINVSIRTENSEIHAAHLMKHLLSGLGDGGGHREMAGGIIKNPERFNKDSFFKQYCDF